MALVRTYPTHPGEYLEHDDARQSMAGLILPSTYWWAASFTTGMFFPLQPYRVGHTYNELDIMLRLGLAGQSVHLRAQRWVAGQIMAVQHIVEPVLSEKITLRAREGFYQFQAPVSLFVDPGNISFDGALDGEERHLAQEIEIGFRACLGPGCGRARVNGMICCANISHELFSYIPDRFQRLARLRVLATLWGVGQTVQDWITLEETCLMSLAPPGECPSVIQRDCDDLAMLCLNCAQMGCYRVWLPELLQCPACSRIPRRRDEMKRLAEIRSDHLNAYATLPGPLGQIAERTRDFCTARASHYRYVPPVIEADENRETQRRKPEPIGAQDRYIDL